MFYQTQARQLYREYYLSNHAHERMAQRNITDKEIAFTFECGTRYYCGGAIHIYLRRKDIPQRLRKEKQFAKIEGTTLVLSQDQPMIVTVYRNKKGLRKIRSKPKYGRQPFKYLNRIKLL